MKSFKSGFALVEITVATTLIALVVVMFLNVFMAGLKNLDNAKKSITNFSNLVYNLESKMKKFKEDGNKGIVAKEKKIELFSKYSQCKREIKLAVFQESFKGGAKNNLSLMTAVGIREEFIYPWPKLVKIGYFNHFGPMGPNEEFYVYAGQKSYFRAVPVFNPSVQHSSIGFVGKVSRFETRYFVSKQKYDNIMFEDNGQELNEDSDFAFPVFPFDYEEVYNSGGLFYLRNLDLGDEFKGKYVLGVFRFMDQSDYWSKDYYAKPFYILPISQDDNVFFDMIPALMHEKRLRFSNGEAFLKYPFPMVGFGDYKDTKNKVELQGKLKMYSFGVMEDDKKSQFDSFYNKHRYLELKNKNQYESKRHFNGDIEQMTFFAVIRSSKNKNSPVYSTTVYGLEDNEIAGITLNTRNLEVISNNRKTLSKVDFSSKLNEGDWNLVTFTVDFGSENYIRDISVNNVAVEEEVYQEIMTEQPFSHESNKNYSVAESFLGVNPRKTDKCDVDVASFYGYKIGFSKDEIENKNKEFMKKYNLH